MLCFRNVPETNMFMDKRAGDQDFKVKVFCLKEPENLAGESFCAVLQKIPLAKKFMEENWEHQDFPSQFVQLTVTKTSVDLESFSVSLDLGIGKTCVSEG